MTIVTTKLVGDILHVTINNPPVNATSKAVRQGLMDAVAEAKTARAVVLRCTGRTWIAGGDMAEFDKAAQAPDLPDVVAAIEHSPAPWLALLYGTVLGGGLEIALGCSHRIALSDTRFALPEVSVGLIPGAGGSQRLPRLVGFELACDMVTTGKMVDTKTMLEAGGIDALTDDLEATATVLMANPPSKPTPVSALPRPMVTTDFLATTRARLAKTSKGANAPFHNLSALLWACETDFSEGQPRERALHLTLRQSAESKALRHAFFSERTAARPAAIKGATPQNIKTVAIVGGGLMGAGIAASMLFAGMKVVLLEVSHAAAQAGRDRVTSILEGAVKRGKLDAQGLARLQAELVATDDYNAAKNADLGLEAVFEDLSVKQQVFSKLAAHLPANALLATNTSYLNPHDIFAGIKNPSRCLGLHYFSPAHIMKLVEIVALNSTSPETLASGFTLAKKQGKNPVLSGVCDGFIGNRMLAAYRRAADYLLADGAMPAQIDAAMRGFGMPMGPYELQDLTGLQISYANRQRQAANRPESERYVDIGDKLVEMGRTGQRAGKGWYRYDGGRSPLEDAEVSAMIHAAAARQLTFSDQEIVARLLAALINEGQRILDEGIAATAGDIDVVQILGYGFPRWRGGPMHYGDTLENLSDMVAALAAQSPGSWVLADKFKG
ncbi:MAG: enoyl-CoA hydratase/isomerase family protein [Rhodobacteraceae bacterium]|nr:enoyl-CoA hydratase/isomerase family protein [Paracoccaceae bacterium]